MRYRDESRKISLFLDWHFTRPCLLDQIYIYITRHVILAIKTVEETLKFFIVHLHDTEKIKKEQSLHSSLLKRVIA